MKITLMIKTTIISNSHNDCDENYYVNEVLAIPLFS